MTVGYSLIGLAEGVAKELRGSATVSTLHHETFAAVDTGVGIPLRIWEDADILRSKPMRHFSVAVNWPRLPDGTPLMARDVMTEEEEKRGRPVYSIDVRVTEPQLVAKVVIAMRI